MTEPFALISKDNSNNNQSVYSNACHTVCSTRDIRNITQCSDCNYDCEWTQLKIDKRGNVWIGKYMPLPANDVCYIIFLIKCVISVNRPNQANQLSKIES